MAKKKTKLEVVWTGTAEILLESILSFWIEKNQSIEYAEKLVSQIWERIDHLSTYPQSAKQSDFKNTRISILGHFSILYQVRNNQLIITAIWDNRDDPKKLNRILKRSSNDQ